MHGVWLSLCVFGGVSIAVAVMSLSLITGGVLFAEIILGATAILAGVLMPILALISRVVIDVHDDHVAVAFTPLARRRIGLDTLASVCAKTDPSVGGVGVRWTPGYGWAYTMGGRGVEFVTHDKRTLFVSCNNPEEVVATIRAIRPDVVDDGP